ncbi:MAG TPA: flavodoxin domain-containing protein, partial [Puia sp.]
MLTTPKLKTLQELLAGATKEELIWLSGYLAGVVAQTGVASVPVGALPAAQEPEAPAKPAVGKVTIAYGTETGNSKKVATDFAARAKKKGINAKLVGLEQYRLTDLPKEEYFFTVISTQGDGEPPASAKKFYDHIHRETLQLGSLKYGVLALGDTSYPLFCKAGEDVDQQLNRMGGQRIVNLQKCDTDYETEAGSWFDGILQKLLSTGAPAPSTPVAAPRKTTGKKIYTGTILNNVNLNDIGSGKQTHHLEIAAEAEYQPGDSIGITPENPREIVEAILSLTGVNPAHKVTFREEELTASDVLIKKLNVVFLHERVVKKYAAIVGQDIPETRMGLLDLLKIYPVKDAAQFLDVVRILEPIAPRLYSISSSPEAHGGEIHITVAKDSFVVNGETKHGLCSDALSLLSAERELEFYVHRNSQ